MPLLRCCAHAPAEIIRDMVIRNSNQRRRRVILDESVTLPFESEPKSLREPKVAEKPVQTERKRRAYSSGANRRNQSKTTDFIPKRPWPLAFVIAGLTFVLAGLNLL